VFLRTENRAFQKWDLLPFSREEGRRHLLSWAPGPLLKRANLNHWTRGPNEVFSSLHLRTETDPVFRNFVMEKAKKKKKKKQ
jgi:hypothetical protein